MHHSGSLWPDYSQPHHSKEPRFLLTLQETRLVGDDGPGLNAMLDLGYEIMISPDALYMTEKVAAYLDRMSPTLHGDQKTQQTNPMINRILKMEGIHVNRIPWNALTCLDA